MHLGNVDDARLEDRIGPEPVRDQGLPELPQISFDADNAARDGIVSARVDYESVPERF